MTQSSSDPDDRHGRVVAHQSENNENQNQGDRKRKARRAVSAPKEDPETEKPAPKRSKKKASVEEEFDTSWICCECKEAECMMKPEADSLMICEGTCRRLFHYPCAGLQDLPQDAYVCQDCQQNRHACSICQEYGIDGEEVFKCSRDDCGLFFHENCLALHEVPVQVEYEGEEHQKPSFVCYSHECYTCTERCFDQNEINTGAKGKKARLPVHFRSKSEPHLVRCIECSLAYHITCIPLLSRFHELALLCHKHSDSHKLPDLDPKHSIQMKIEEKIEKKYEVVQKKARNRSKGLNPFFAGVDGSCLTFTENEMLGATEKVQEGFSESDILFCLPCDLKDEVYSKPPAYKHLQGLRYDPNNKPKRQSRSGEKCECVGFCGEECLNRVLYIECSGKENGKSNCNVGQDCGNRQLTQRKHKKTKVQPEQGRGWGLALLENARKGDLITEYIGEVIDPKEKERRLEEWTKDHPNDPNFYVMSLGSDWFIDARLEGNFSRFINHSCGPNCILLPINVDGFIRNGIFALRDIEAGEFLSYDYHFDTKHADRFWCRCGAPKCRGSMQGGFKNAASSDTRKSLSERWSEAKTRYEREKRFVEDFYEKALLRTNLVNMNVPAAENPEETVANGTQRRFREEAYIGRIYLWRNARKGSNFSSRLGRLKGKAKR